MNKILVLDWVSAEADPEARNWVQQFGCRNPGEEWGGERGRQES